MRKFLKVVFIVFFTLSVVFYSDRMSSAAAGGLSLWLNTVVPSLCPFMVISSWLSFDFRKGFGTADRITRSLFGVPSAYMALFPVSILSGYPAGAKIISDLYTKKAVSKDTAEHLLSFCNNPGAVFMVSAVASSMLSDRASAVFFIFICLLASLTTGILYNFVFPAEVPSAPAKGLSRDVSFYSAISSAVGAILLVGGCIIFFSVIAEAVSIFLSSSDPLVNTLISGLLEFTQGIRQAAGLEKSIGYPIICALLCWGGLSVHLQTAAIIGDCGIDIRKYLVSKAFCATCGYIYAVLFYGLFFSEGKSVGVFSEIHVLPEIYDSPSLFAVSAFLAAALFLFLGEKKSRR